MAVRSDNGRRINDAIDFWVDGKHNQYQEHASQPGTAADCNLEQRVGLFLSQRGIPCNGAIQVEANSGTVTLRGMLPSSDAKLLCLECCRYVAGVINLVDQLHVEELDSRGDVSVFRQKTH